jgi:hypothetical protein
MVLLERFEFGRFRSYAMKLLDKMASVSRLV